MTDRIGFEDEREAQRYYGICPECGGRMSGGGSVCTLCALIYLELMALHSAADLITEHRKLADAATERKEEEISWDDERSAP